MCEHNEIQKESTEKGTSDLFSMHDINKPRNDQKT